MSNTDDNTPVDTSNAKIIPNIGQPRAETSEEIREDQDQPSGVAKFPSDDPKAAHEKAVRRTRRIDTAREFKTDDLTGTTVNGEEGGRTSVIVRLLYDWWDGEGNRHPLNSEIELPLNEARRLVDERKAERTDPL